MTKTTITRLNEFNVRVETYNTALEPEVYSYVKVDTFVQISVRGAMNKSGKGYKWSTLNPRVHWVRFDKIAKMVKESGV